MAYDWRSIGYSDAMKQCTRSSSTKNYPTQDKWTPLDEREYLKGWEEGIADFKNSGYNPVWAYAQEHKNI